MIEMTCESLRANGGPVELLQFSLFLFIYFLLLFFCNDNKTQNSCFNLNIFQKV